MSLESESYLFLESSFIWLHDFGGKQFSKDGAVQGARSARLHTAFFLLNPIPERHLMLAGVCCTRKQR